MKQGRKLMPLITVVFALLLTLLPLPDALAGWRPYWVALVVIYWHLETHQLGSLGAGFAIGLIVDLSTGTLLGQHALSLVIINFLVGRFRNRIRFFPPWQQAMAIGALLFNDRIVQLWIVGLLQLGWPGWSWWLPPLIGIGLWPWLFLLLDALRWRARVPQ